MAANGFKWCVSPRERERERVDFGRGATARAEGWGGGGEGSRPIIYRRVSANYPSAANDGSSKCGRSQVNAAVASGFGIPARP